jgi:hypothetical protein
MLGTMGEKMEQVFKLGKKAYSLGLYPTLKFKE